MVAPDIPSPGVTPDDVSIKCKVNWSPCAMNPKFEGVQDMICTIRNWTDTGVYNSGAEIEASNVKQQRNKSLNYSRENSTYWGAPSPRKAPQLVLCPRYPSLLSSPRGDSLTSLISDERAAAFAEKKSHRFQTFGSSTTARSSPDTSSTSNTSFSGERDIWRASKSRENSSESLSARKSTDEQRNNASLELEHEKTFPCNNNTTPAEKHRIKASDVVVDNKQSESSCEDLRIDTRFFREAALTRSYIIPISDIVTIDLHGHHMYGLKNDPYRQKSSSWMMSLITASNGYFYLSFDSKNAHDVMLAFLQSSLTLDRISNGDILSVQSDNQSFDVDYLTAKEIKGWLEGETLADRLDRRIRLALARFAEMSLSVTECVCDRPRLPPTNHVIPCASQL